MSSAGQTFKNFVVLSGAQAVTMVTGLITTVILARVLGPETYGVLGFGVAIFSYFMLVVNMGVDVHGMREIAYDQSRTAEIVGTILPLRFSLATMLFCLLYLLTITMNQPERVRTVVLIQGFGLFATALTIDFVYQGFQRMGVIALRQCIAAIVGVSLVVVLVSAPSNLYEAAAIPVAVGIATASGMLGFFLCRGGYLELSFDLSRWQRYLRQSAPIAFMVLMSTVLLNTDIVFIGFMREQEEVGWYVAAAKVLTFALIAGNMLHNAFLPALAKSNDGDKQRLAYAHEHASAVLFIGAPICFVGIAFAAPIIDIIFGSAYAGAENALIILMLTAAAAYLVTAHGTPLFAWKCDKPYALTLGIGGATNVVLNFVLIPRYGIEGAAVATFICQTCMWISLATITHRRFRFNHLKLITRVVVTVLVSGIPVSFCVEFVSAGPVPTVFVGSFAFGVLYSVVAQTIGIYDLRRLPRLLVWPST